MFKILASPGDVPYLPEMGVVKVLVTTSMTGHPLCHSRLLVSTGMPWHLICHWCCPVSVTIPRLPSLTMVREEDNLKAECFWINKKRLMLTLKTSSSLKGIFFWPFIWNIIHEWGWVVLADLDFMHELSWKSSYLDFMSLYLE